MNRLTEAGRRQEVESKRAHRARMDEETRERYRQKNREYRAAHLERIREQDRAYSRAYRARNRAECSVHPGEHCEPIACPECGKFSRDSWDTGPHFNENGFQQQWGGICKTHGEWSDSA